VEHISTLHVGSLPRLADVRTTGILPGSADVIRPSQRAEVAARLGPLHDAAEIEVTRGARLVAVQKPGAALGARFGEVALGANRGPLPSGFATGQNRELHLGVSKTARRLEPLPGRRVSARSLTLHPGANDQYHARLLAGVTPLNHRPRPDVESARCLVTTRLPAASVIGEPRARHHESVTVETAAPRLLSLH
jgi:hypothetical protein